IQKDFEGYRVYAGEERDDLRLVAQYDLATPPHDTTGFNTGLESARLPTPVVIDGVTYQYRYTLPNVRNGFKYFAAVTAYDMGTSELQSLASGRPQNHGTLVPSTRVGTRPAGR